ncbi:unnamed protein product, partial [marine sediment metagenome]
MAKDPAFLFYATDFYEGTRMMLPEERACFIDLLIYQHQHEFIPTDLKRVAMYCAGINEATLKATLEAKFKLCDKGWYNEKMQTVVLERKSFSNKQSVNGKIGQFWKKSKAILNKKEYVRLRETLVNTTNIDLLNLIKETVIDKAMLIAMLKHLEDEDRNEDVIKKEELIFPFDSEDFKSHWGILVKQAKWKNKSPEALQAALKKLSIVKEEVATQAILDSIAGNYQGIFPENVKIGNNGQFTEN